MTRRGLTTTVVCFLASLSAAACVTIVQAPSTPSPSAATASPSASVAPAATVAPTPLPTPSPSPRPASEIAAAATVLVRSPFGHGSGAYLGGGRVITAAHVVEDAGPYTVYFADRVVGRASIDRLDPINDLALLSVAGLDAAGATALAWGDPTRLRLGEPIIAAGYPSVVGFTVTQGIFSGLKRDSGGTEYVQTDAAINPGNSGGPLVDSTGRLIGIADWKVVGAQGLGFAVSASVARPFAETAVIAAPARPTTTAAAAPTGCTLPPRASPADANLCTLYAGLEVGQPANRISLDVSLSADTRTQTLSVYQGEGGQEQRLWFATAKSQRSTATGDFFGEVFTFRPRGSTQEHVVYVAMRCAQQVCGPYTAFVDAVVSGVFGQIFRTDTNSATGADGSDGTLVVVSPAGVRQPLAWTGTTYR